MSVYNKINELSRRLISSNKFHGDLLDLHKRIKDEELKKEVFGLLMDMIKDGDEVVKINDNILDSYCEFLEKLAVDSKKP